MSHEIQEVAYVIKRFFPHRQKIGLLTYSLGRINVTVIRQDECMRLWPGMLVTCNIAQTGLSWSSNRIIIHSVPIPQSHPNILWLHHILELCYYFLPLENPCGEIFFYLQQCYNFIHQNNICDPLAQDILKKLCVIKFLSLIGFYAQEEVCQYITLFQELSDLFIDFTNEQKVDFLKQRLLLCKTTTMNEWILNCLKSHPMFNNFKTIDANYYDKRGLQCKG